MLRKLPFIFALFAAFSLSGCNDDDPVNDRGIDDVTEFDIDDYTKVSSSNDLAGLWVAVGTGTFERDKSGDRKYGEQSAKIYFLIKGSAGSYTYANCFDEGYLKGGFNRGGFESLAVTDDTIVFDSDKVVGDDTELSSEDSETSNTGTVTNNEEINATFTFNDGKSKEVNTFQMYKVSNDGDTAFGTSTFNEDNESPVTDTVGCFAQWSGSYSTSDGLYTVERFDASFIADNDPFSADETMSDAEDITEYSSISYNTTTSANTKNSDSVNFFYLVNSLNFGVVSSGSSTGKAGIINISHTNL